jgi:hypothetical protein
VPQDSFQLECDRISNIVDGTLCERLRWERNEGPMLVEEGATRDLKRFVLKIHGNRVFSITLSISGAQAQVDASPIERSKYGLAPGGIVTSGYESVDEAWMTRALEQQFGRVRASAQA